MHWTFLPHAFRTELTSNDARGDDLLRPLLRAGGNSLQTCLFIYSLHVIAYDKKNRTKITTLAEEKENSRKTERPPLSATGGIELLELKPYKQERNF